MRRVQSKSLKSYVGVVVWAGSPKARVVVRWDCGITQSVSPEDLQDVESWWEETTVVRRHWMPDAKAG